MITNRAWAFTPKKMTEYIRNLKSQSLRQVITQQYLRIGGIKAKISESKRSVRDMVNQTVYSHIIDVFISNNYSVKFSEKDRLKKKFEWLEDQHRNRTPSSSTSDQVAVGPIDEPLADRITAIQVELTEQEQALLSLGPNFALCPKVDEWFINQVNMEIAAWHTA